MMQRPLLPQSRSFAVLALALAACLAGCGSTVSLAQQAATGSLGGGVLAPTDGNPTTAPGAAIDGTSPGAPNAGVPGAPVSPTDLGAGPSTGSTSTTPVQTSGIPQSGRGWDATHVYIGVPTADDFNSVAKNLGANFDNGSFEGDVNAVVADINKSGGLFGRKVVPAYRDIKTLQAASNPEGTAQQMCTYFTQDRPVIAVVSPAPQLDSSASFHRCLEKYSVPLISLSNTAFSDKDYSKLGPHLWTVASLSTDILIPSFLTSLSRQGFFGGWNTTTGTPAKTAVKAGILLPDDTQGRYVGALMSSGLKRLGIPIGAEFFYDPSGQGKSNQSEVLKFQSAGVTHVLDLPPVELEVTQFQTAAQQQHYHPRYGFTSFDLPLSVQENSSLAPPAQQIGSMGIGWQPYNDTDTQHDPGATTGSNRCLAVMRQGGQTFASNHRRAELIASQFCDSLNLIADAVRVGKGFSGASFLSAIPTLGNGFATAGTFKSNLSTSSHAVPGYYRDEQYLANCKCFAYNGPNRFFAR